VITSFVLKGFCILVLFHCDYFFCFFLKVLCSFGFIVIVAVTIFFCVFFCILVLMLSHCGYFWFFLKVLCIRVYKKESEKKGFTFVVAAAAAGDGKDPKGNIVKATAYR
jgi:hypothetical protein